MPVGQHDEIEIFVGFDQLINYKQCVVRGNIVIHRSVGQKQMPLQVLGDVLVRLVVIVTGSIRLLLQQSDVAFRPIVFVLAIVMIAGF